MLELLSLIISNSTCVDLFNYICSLKTRSINSDLVNSDGQGQCLIEKLNGLFLTNINYKSEPETFNK